MPAAACRRGVSTVDLLVVTALIAVGSVAVLAAIEAADE